MMCSGEVKNLDFGSGNNSYAVETIEGALFKWMNFSWGEQGNIFTTQPM